MNYAKHYYDLIERARHRTIDGYTEKHHIVPRCLGGDDKNENIVKLTAREHYVAHQLLVKINPEHQGLIKSAVMMTCGNTTAQRFNNRLYEWLRIQHARVMVKSQTGKKNSQYGTVWISNISTKKSIKVQKNELDDYLTNGWIKRRILNWNNIKVKCKGCGSAFLQKRNEIYCNSNCRVESRPNKIGDNKNEFYQYYKKYKTVNKTIIEFLGYSGGESHAIAKKIINEIENKQY